MIAYRAPTWRSSKVLYDACICASLALRLSISCLFISSGDRGSTHGVMYCECHASSAADAKSRLHTVQRVEWLSLVIDGGGMLAEADEVDVVGLGCEDIVRVSRSSISGSGFNFPSQTLCPASGGHKKHQQAISRYGAQARDMNRRSLISGVYWLSM